MSWIYKKGKRHWAAKTHLICLIFISFSSNLVELHWEFLPPSSPLLLVGHRQSTSCPSHPEDILVSWVTSTRPFNMEKWQLYSEPLTKDQPPHPASNRESRHISQDAHFCHFDQSTNTCFARGFSNVTQYFTQSPCPRLFLQLWSCYWVKFEIFICGKWNNVHPENKIHLIYYGLLSY